MGLPVIALFAVSAVLLAAGGVESQSFEGELHSHRKCGRLSTDRTDVAEEEGRAKMKKKGRVLLSLILGLKMLALSVAVPLIVALALYSAWKGVTISLLAFMIASIVGLKSLIAKSHHEVGAHNLIVAKVPGGGGQEQWWRRLGGEFAGGLDPYRGYGLQPF